jgi:hypothetical protein
MEEIEDSIPIAVDYRFRMHDQQGPSLNLE